MTVSLSTRLHAPAVSLPQGSGRREWIVELRGFLALYVLWHHAVANIDTSGAHDALWRWSDTVFGPGHFRVDIFFVLSGYCLALSLKGRHQLASFPSFLAQRSARLLPPYFVALGLSFWLLQSVIGQPTGTHWDASVPLQPGSLLSHVLLVHNWWPQFAVNLNHPLWSIAVEYQLYWLFPALLALHRLLGPWKAWSAVTLLSYAAWRLESALGVGNPSPYGTSFYYAALFSMGMAAAQLGRMASPLESLSPSDRNAVVFTVSVMVVWAGLCLRHYGDLAIQIQSFFVGLTTMCAFMFERHWRLFSQKAPGTCRRWLRHLGERSYSLYLLHAPMLQLTWLWLVKRLHLRSSGLQALAEVALGSLLSLFAAELFYRAVEQPTHRWARSLH